MLYLVQDFSSKRTSCVIGTVTVTVTVIVIVTGVVTVIGTVRVTVTVAGFLPQTWFDLAKSINICFIQPELELQTCWTETDDDLDLNLRIAKFPYTLVTFIPFFL